MLGLIFQLNKLGLILGGNVVSTWMQLSISSIITTMTALIYCCYYFPGSVNYYIASSGS